MPTPDVLLRMQEDLARALARPPASRRWAMLIDTRKCVGCHACTVGCIAENALPPGVMYRPVFEVVDGTFPKVRRTFVARPCQQCDAPPCVAACPNAGKATWKSTEGVSAGLVLIDYEQCIGCGKCVPACPYKARSLDEGRFYSERAPVVPAYEKRPSEEYGRRWPRQAHHLPVGTARKCHFCLHRLSTGRLPMCVTTCIGRATYFGDENDPESLIAEVKRANANALTTLAAVADARPLTDPPPGERRVRFGQSATRPRVSYIV